MKETRTTSREIAELARVSQATVSRALRNSPLVSPETRARVQQIAEQLHYRTDRSAAGLRTRRSHTLALLLFEEPDEGSQINPFFLTMLGHITHAAARRGHDVLVSFQQLSSDWYTDYQLSNRADGIILLGYGDYHDSGPRLDRLAAARAKFVIWGPQIPAMSEHCVSSDNAAGAEQAVRHLLALGRRRIAYIGSATDHWPEFKLRHEGYVRALREAGIEPDPALVTEAQSSEAEGRAAAARLLGSGAAFDAVFAASDLIAIGAIGALRDRGLGVPENVAIVGFDDIATAAHFNPPLTTVQQDTQRAAELLVDNLLRIIAGEPVEPGMIEPRLVVRRSCGNGS